MSEESTVIKNHTLALDVQLTQDELVELGQEVGTLAMEKAGLECELGGIKKDYKDKLAAVDGKMQGIYKKLRDQSVESFVDCQSTFDFDADEVVTVRLDTGVEVERRAIKEVERQMQLPLDEPPVIDGTAEQPDTGADDTDTTSDDELDGIGD